MNKDLEKLKELVKGNLQIVPDKERDKDLLWEAELPAEHWLLYACALREPEEPAMRVMVQMAYGKRVPDPRQRGGYGYQNLSEDCFGETTEKAVENLSKEVLNCGLDARYGFMEAFGICPLCGGEKCS